MNEDIRSKDNRMAKLVRKLARRKYRDELSLFVAEGPNLIADALDSGADIQFALLDMGEGSDAEEIVALSEALISRGIPVHRVESRLYRELCDTETPQSMLGVVAKKVYTERDVFSGDVVVLDRLQDPGNLGTILRTADAAGFSGAVLMKGCGDIFAPKTVRATAGTIFRLPFLFEEDPDNLVRRLRSAGYAILCTAPKGSELVYDIDMSGRVALVIGNEAGGACDTFVDNSDHRARIPMSGRIESLNASVAAGIMMYEAVRQKRK